MENLYKDLKKVLQQEIGLQAQLLDLSEGKRESIIHMKRGSLERYMEEEQLLLQEIRTAEQSRRKIVRNLGFGTEEEELALLDIIPQLDRDHAMDVSDLRGDLAKALQDVDRVNQLNALLLNDAILHIRNFMNLLAKGTERAATYTGYGNLTAAGSRSFMDHSI